MDLRRLPHPIKGCGLTATEFYQSPNWEVIKVTDSKRVPDIIFEEFPNLHLTPYIEMDQIMDYLKEQKKALLIAVDDAELSDQMRIFISLFQIFLRDGYEIALVMAGASKKLRNLMDDETLTFLYRSTRAYLPLQKNNTEIRNLLP